MTYYLVNDNTDAIIEAYPDRPSRAELLKDAKFFNCPVYLIEGQRVGFTVSPPAPADDSMQVHFVNGEVDYLEPGAAVSETDEFPF